MRALGLVLLASTLFTPAEAAPRTRSWTVHTNYTQSDRLIEAQSEAWLDLYGHDNPPGVQGCDPNFVYPELNGISPVLNNRCQQGVLWDIDDLLSALISGDLAAGETASFEQRIVFDEARHLLLFAGSREQHVQFTIAIPELAWSQEVPAGTTACFWSPYRIAPEIPDSNGGHGVEGRVVWSATAARKARDVQLTARVLYPNLGGQAACPGGITQIP